MTDKAEVGTLRIKTPHCSFPSLPLLHIVYVVLYGAILTQIPPIWEWHFRLHTVFSRLFSPLFLGYNRAAVGGMWCFCGLQLPPLVCSEPTTEPPPLLLSPLPGLPALLLPRHLETLQEKVAGIFVQLYVPLVQLADSALRFGRHLNTGGTCAVELCEGRDELQVEGSLEQVLGLTLVLGQSKEGHAPQVAFGALQKYGPSVLLAHGGDVVATNQAEISQHACLPVVGQVVGAVHEFLQGATRPVISRIAAWQL